MRVASSTIYREFNRNMEINQTNMQKYQNQLGTLKEYNKSSDNPLVFAKIIGINDSITQNTNYNATINDSIAWTKTQDSALANATEGLHRIRQLIESSANGTLGEEELRANKGQIVAEFEGIADALNTNFDGRYIFGGRQTTTPPFEVVKDSEGHILDIKYRGTTDKVDSNGNVTARDGNLSREIATGVSVDLISDGRLFMNEKGTAANPDNLSSFATELMAALKNDDKGTLSGSLLSKIDKTTDNFVNIRSKIGTVQNRLEAAKERNETENINLKDILSEKQDVDVVSKYMELSNQTLALRASLSMGTKIMQISILDYV